MNNHSQHLMKSRRGEAPCAPTSLELLVAARVLQGAFGALLAPAALSLLAVTFTEPKERAKAFGIYGAIAGGGGAVGFILGGVLTEYKVRAPLLPLRVITERNRGGVYLSLGLAIIALFGLFLFLTYYMQLV